MPCKTVKKALIRLVAHAYLWNVERISAAGVECPAELHVPLGAGRHGAAELQRLAQRRRHDRGLGLPPPTLLVGLLAAALLAAGGSGGDARGDGWGGV